MRLFLNHSLILRVTLITLVVGGGGFGGLYTLNPAFAHWVNEHKLAFVRPAPAVDLPSLLNPPSTPVAEEGASSVTAATATPGLSGISSSASPVPSGFPTPAVSVPGVSPVPSLSSPTPTPSSSSGTPTPTPTKQPVSGSTPTPTPTPTPILAIRNYLVDKGK